MPSPAWRGSSPSRDPGYALTEERAEIEEHSSFVIDCLEVTALAISSSDLRARWRRDDPSAT